VSTSAWTEIGTYDELVGILGEPDERAAGKGRTAVLDVDRAWPPTSPLCVMATASAAGTCDASPKGDPAGRLVHVIDGRARLVSDAPFFEEIDAYYGPSYEQGLYA
jgi:hypothetical protein